jgi:hypothetical protein
MYSRHAAQFDRLLDACMPPEQVAILRDIFTNPLATLEHKGAVIMSGSLVAPNIQAARWAVAQHNWDYNPDSNYTFTYPSNGGGMAIVVCKEADDYKGNGTTGKNDIIIYLPVTPGDDPNVVKGDVIGFFEMSDGVYMSPGRGDDQIGTVRHDINGNAVSPKGWGVMDGSDNSKAKGGSALDIATNKRFLRQWTSIGNNKGTGGAETDSVAVAAHAGSAVDSAVAIANHNAATTANTTQSAHIPHDHPLTATTIATGTSVSVTLATSANTGDETSVLFHDAHSHTVSALSHSVTGSSALSHAAVDVDTIPPFMYVAFLERLNNSRTGLGL